MLIKNLSTFCHIQKRLTFLSTQSFIHQFNRKMTQDANVNHLESFKPTWDAELYAKARPDYPRSAIDGILNATNSKKLNYVDLAAGTGIFTKLLIDACTNGNGNQYKLNTVTAIEPSQGMLKQLQSSLFDTKTGIISQWKANGKLDQDVQTFTGSGLFDTIDLTPIAPNLQGNIDLITIAQAWHWCENWNGALEQLANVLKPGGILAIVWNLEDREAAKWVAAVREIYEEYEGNSRQYRHGTWKQMYKTEAINLYEILPEIHLCRGIPTTVEGVCSRIASKSYISMEPKENQKKVLDNIRKLFNENNDQDLQRKWIDQSSDVFEFPYTTDVLLFRKK